MQFSSGFQWENAAGAAELTGDPEWMQRGGEQGPSHEGFLLTNEEDRSERVDVLQSIREPVEMLLGRSPVGSKWLRDTVQVCPSALVTPGWSSRSHPLKQSSLCCRDWAVPQVLICWAAQKIICWQTATAAWKLKKKKDKWNKTRS